MKFPMLNVTDKNWNEEFDLTVFILFKKYVYKGNDDIFHKYYKDKVYCDAEGMLYKVVDKAPSRETWRNLLKFLPGVFRVELTFESLHKTVELEELRRFMLNRLKELEEDEIVNQWRKKIKAANNHAEIIDCRDGYSI